MRAASSPLVHAKGQTLWGDFMPADPSLHRLAKRACRTAHHLTSPRTAARAATHVALHPSRDSVVYWKVQQISTVADIRSGRQHWHALCDFDDFHMQEAGL